MRIAGNRSDVAARRVLKLPAMCLMAGVLALAACTTGGGPGAKQIGGTVLGGALGGLAGAQIGQGKGQLAATAAGALLGAFIGGEAGKSLDRADRLYLQQTQQSALETSATGQVAQWQNPESGNRGEIRPIQTFQQSDGTYCREFEQTIWVENQSETARGTACRQADGSWRIVN